MTNLFFLKKTNKQANKPEKENIFPFFFFLIETF